MEGIVLRTLPYQENRYIVTLFTPQGVMKLLSKRVKKEDLHGLALLAPLTRGEYLFSLRKNDLHKFLDGTIFDQHLPLRDDLDKMQVAQKMISLLLKTQLPSRPSFDLYLLFAKFLKRTCQTANLFIPFMIKLLKFEGLLDLTHFSPLEQELISHIASLRSLQELEKLSYEGLLDFENNQTFRSLYM